MLRYKTLSAVGAQQGGDSGEVTLVGSATYEITTASQALTLPTGTAVGDTVFVAGFESSSGFFNTDFIALNDLSNDTGRIGERYGIFPYTFFSFRFHYKRIQSSADLEPSARPFFGNANRGAALLVTLRGIDPSSFSVASSSTNSSAFLQPRTEAITPSVSNQRVIIASCYQEEEAESDYSPELSVPAGWTLGGIFGPSQADGTCAIIFKVQDGPTATTEPVAVFGGASATVNRVAQISSAWALAS